MPNITQVNLTAGVPTGPAGAATVSTIDNMVNLFPTLAAVTATGNAMDINVKSGGNANGQTTMSASAPVVIASDQSAVSTKGSLAIASTTSGQTGNLTMGAVTTAAPSYTTAQTDPLSLTTAGALRMDMASVAGTVTPVGSGVMATAPRVALATDSPGIVTLGQAVKASSVPVTIASDQGSLGAFSSQYPSGATPITASSTGTTGATTATLAGTGGKTTYISGFTITSDATAALAGTATVTGTITGTLNYIQNVGGATAAGILTQSFSPSIPASATNTGIAVNSVAAGTGGNTAVTAWGYQL